MQDESVYQARLDNFDRANERLILENALLDIAAATAGLDLSVTQLSEPIQLTSEALSAVCRLELKSLVEATERAKDEAEVAEEILRLELDLAELAISELKRDAFEFKRDVVVGAQHPATAKPVAEQVTQYFETRLIESDVTIKDLITRSQDLKSKVIKAEAKSKRKPSSDVQYIDFHQLQIESQQLTREANALKSELDDARFACRAARQDLAQLRADTEQLEKEVGSQSRQIDKLKDSTVKSKLDLLQASSDRNLISQEIKALQTAKAQNSFKHEEEFEPMRLIHQQVQVQQLQRLVKSLERKLELIKGVRSLKWAY